MFCPVCGKENVSEARFCAECGSALFREWPEEQTEAADTIYDLTLKKVHSPQARRRIFISKILFLLLGIASIVLAYYIFLFRPFGYYGRGLLGGLGTVLILVSIIYLLIASYTPSRTRRIFIPLSADAMLVYFTLLTVVVLFVGSTILIGGYSTWILVYGFFAQPKAWIIERLNEIPAPFIVENNFFQNYCTTIPDVLNSEARTTFIAWLIFAAITVVVLILLYQIAKRSIVKKYPDITVKIA